MSMREGVHNYCERLPISIGKQFVWILNLVRGDFVKRVRSSMCILMGNIDCVGEMLDEASVGLGLIDGHSSLLPLECGRIEIKMIDVNSFSIFRRTYIRCYE